MTIYNVGIREYGLLSFYQEIEAISEEEALELARIRYLNNLSFHIMETSDLKRYIKILDIDHSDAYYNIKDSIIGRTFEISIKDFKNIHETMPSWFYVDVNPTLSLFTCRYEEITK